MVGYPGFEKDVFKVIKDYFENQSEPLVTFDLYEAFTNVMGAFKCLVLKTDYVFYR